MNPTEPLPLWTLVTNASLVVQFVMAMLLVISMVSWAMIFERYFALKRIEAEIDDFEERFWSGTDLRKLFASVEAQAERITGIESVFVAGFKEFSRNRQTSGDADAMMQAIQNVHRVSGHEVRAVQPSVELQGALQGGHQHGDHRTIFSIEALPSVVRIHRDDRHRSGR